MRYRLRTLLIILTLAPLVLGWLHRKLVPRQPSPALIAAAWKLLNGKVVTREPKLQLLKPEYPTG